jgi:hypothetical protein
MFFKSAKVKIGNANTFHFSDILNTITEYFAGAVPAPPSGAPAPANQV